MGLCQNGKRFGIGSVGCFRALGLDENLLAFFELVEGGEVLRLITNPSVQKTVM
jgi:hypothetical protein